jgi:hypothetical protein
LSKTLLSALNIRHSKLQRTRWFPKSKKLIQKSWVWYLRKESRSCQLEEGGIGD